MKRILIVEDDAVLNSLLAKILSENYKVLTVSNGKDALSLISDGNIPDLIISDIKLPLMDGLELLESLKISAQFKNIPVIVVSCIDDQGIRKKCLDFGVIAYMVKPFDPQKLLKEIEYPFASKVFS